MSESGKWFTPFTRDQVAILNGYQVSGIPHPYTCENDRNHPKLEAYIDGLRCLACKYIQNWAHTTEDPYRIVGLRGAALVQALIIAKWYALEDDTIGGWCIMPVPLPPSYGYPHVGNFLDKEIAEDIADTHNMELADWECKDY